jgi:hypothetical protein
MGMFCQWMALGLSGLVMYPPALVCLRNGGRVGGWEMEDIEGAAIADLVLVKTRTMSRWHAAGRQYPATVRVVCLINRGEDAAV